MPPVNASASAMALFVTLWSLLAAFPVGAATPPAQASHSLDSAFHLVRDAVEQNEIPGAIALVARGGKIARHEAYSLRDIENRLPFTSNTLCWIASITKPVTVAAAMTLVDAGKLALDDPVEMAVCFRDRP